MSTPDLQRLLTAPILPTLLRLATPNVLAQNQGSAGHFVRLEALNVVAYGVLTAAAIWLPAQGPKPREIP